jgi:hypothetical protein
MSEATIVILTSNAGFSHDMLVEMRALDQVVRVDGVGLQKDGTYHRFDVHLATPEAAALFMRIAAQNFPSAKITEIT